MTTRLTGSSFALMRDTVLFLLVVVGISIVIGGIFGIREDEVISGLVAGFIIGAALAGVLGLIIYLVAKYENRNNQE